MKNLWNNRIAKKISNDSLAMRVYTSRLLGTEEDLVLHGGGNTSVKLTERTLFGEQEVLYVKGSGWDLATIQPEGFSPIKLRELLILLEQDALADTDLVRYQRQLMMNPFAPNPSIEALLHALIPLKFVDHTHADAILAVTNTPRGEHWIKEIYGEKVVVVPYVKPGFVLAKEVFRRTRNLNWRACDGIILMNHGVFTFDDNAAASYGRMISLVTKAERFLRKKGARTLAGTATGKTDPLLLAQIRKSVSEKQGRPLIALSNTSTHHTAFSESSTLRHMAARGPITPDHVIRTKIAPVLLGRRPRKEIDAYEKSYNAYFKKFRQGRMTRLDPAPRWALWPGHGTVAFGSTPKEAAVVSDIVNHLLKTVQMAAALGGWRPLSNKDLFEIEYWDLEQAKLKKAGSAPIFQGYIALVTGAASGIGKACVESLMKKGAAVAALDIDPKVEKIFAGENFLPLRCDITQPAQVLQAIQKTVGCFGGLDFLVSNAGIFPDSHSIAEMNSEVWRKSLDINLTSHRVMIQASVPFLELGVNPGIVVIGSKNVPAPGPGQSAYSVAKAGLTQLARVAALELGPKKIRVNVIHPNAVYDTAIWTEKILKTRAKNYGISVEKYRTNNIMGVSITSADVAEMVSVLFGPIFQKTTGAQIPLDGGNERVI